MLNLFPKELKVKLNNFCLIYSTIDHTKIKNLNLSRCSLKDEGFMKIIKNAPYHLVELDISENSTLGINCYEVLANYLENRDQS